MYSYDEAYKASLEYFNSNELAAKVFVDKYALRDNDDNLLELTPDDMHWRLAKEFARKDSQRAKGYRNYFPLSEEEIYKLFKQYGQIIPQGSPISAIGNPYQYLSASNCFVVEPPSDSYAGILYSDEQLVNIAKRRGGTGIDLSKLRPVGTPTKNSSRTSTGILSWMKRYSNSIREVGQGGRRGALMMTINVHHPQVLDFIRAKDNETEVTGANVSVQYTDEFLQAVEDDDEYEQRWPIDTTFPTVSRMVKARDIWKETIHYAWKRAEPGVQFIDQVFRESLADCYEKFGFKTVTSNPSLRGDSLVLTANGIFPIKELAEKTIIVKNIKGEWHNAFCTKTGENKQLYKITFTNSEVIYCTPEHKWPILNSLGNVVNRHTGKIIVKRTDELEQQDKIYLPEQNDPFITPCEFDNEDGFVLGWTVGDGWTSYHRTNQSNQLGWSFSQEDKDSGIADRLLNYTNNLAKIPSSIRQDHDCNSYTYCTTDDNILARFERLQFKQKYEIPQSIWKGSTEFVKGFIDGLFSADGSIDVQERLSKCRISLTSKNIDLLNQVRKLLNFFGIRSHIDGPYTQKGNFPNGKDYQKEYIRYALVISGKHTYKFAKIFELSNLAKKDKLSQILTTGLLDISYVNNREYLVVKSVELTDTYEDVYDIQVNDETHTFMTECGVTGNCSEIFLSILDSCRLLAINIFSCVEFPFTEKSYFNYKKFYELAKKAQRLADILVDLEAELIQRIINKIEHDPEQDYIKERELNLWKTILDVGLKGRRTGVGLTALGDTLAAINIKYGSEESIEIVDRIYKTMKFGCFRESVNMAKTLGPFPIFDNHLENNNPFLLRFKDEKCTFDDKWGEFENGIDICEDMARYGRRNIALLTTAPTGTISTQALLMLMLFGTTSGFEPAFKESYRRRKKGNHTDKHFRVDFTDKSGDTWMEFDVYHEGVNAWKQINKDKSLDENPYRGCCAEEINWENRVKMQAAAQKHIDHSISSTVNLPETATEEDVNQIFLTAWKSGCKGITVYRNNCRSGVLIDKEEKDKSARPSELPCELHHFSVKSEKFWVAIGLKDDKPYEVFAGRGALDADLKFGSIVKTLRPKGYKAVFDDFIISPLTIGCGEFEQAFLRMISTNLRHGTPLHFIVDQLEKSTGDIYSFARAIARALKKYIADGESSGEKCPECNAELKFAEGCKSCKCGWSKCS